MAEIETKRCTKCGITKPISDFNKSSKGKNGIRAQCRECTIAYGRIHYPAEYRRLRYNSEYAHEYYKRYVHPNPQRAKLLKRLRYYRNAEEIRARRQQRRHEMVEGDRIRRNRRYSKQQSLPSTFTAQDWKNALAYFNNLCAYCGHGPSFFDANLVLHQEHYVPMSAGGSYTPDNIIPACQSCNLSKSTRLPMEWMIERFGKSKAKKIAKRIQDYFDSLNGPRPR